MNAKLSRRAWFARCGSVYVAATAGLLGACAKKSAETASCQNSGSLSEADRQARAAFGYVEVSTVPNRDCANCSVYIAPPDGGPCGGCQLMKGGIAAAGYCNAWAPKGV